MRILFTLVLCSWLSVQIHAQNVGIGTETPERPLHISGSGELLRLQGFTPWLGFMNPFDANYRGFLYYPDTSLVMGSIAGSDMRLILAPNNIALLHATANQRIGIGTAAPQEKLDVQGNIKSDGLLRFGGAAPASFRINLTGTLRYSTTSPLVQDTSTGLFVIINHPLCNNDPNALIHVTSIDAPIMRLYYEPANGFWFMRLAVGFLANNQNRWNVLITKN